MGRFIEFGEFGGNNIHGWMHNAAATQFGESVLSTLDSPLSTYFYQLHGLIENWRLARQQAVPMVEVPDLLSHTASRAVKIAHALLLNKGLRFRDVGALQITDSSGQSLPGHVTAQDPRGGAMVERGTEVVLQIGDYHADPITHLGHAHP
jgi:PASTA domain